MENLQNHEEGREVVGRAGVGGGVGKQARKRRKNKGNFPSQNLSQGHQGRPRKTLLCLAKLPWPPTEPAVAVSSVTRINSSLLLLLYITNSRFKISGGCVGLSKPGLKKTGPYHSFQVSREIKCLGFSSSVVGHSTPFPLRLVLWRKIQENIGNKI